MGNKRLSSLSSVLYLLVASSCVSQKEPTKSKLLSEGSGAVSSRIQPLTVPNNTAPTPDVGVSKVASGSQHTCVIQSGKLSCWGLNKHGQIGNGDSGVVNNTPDPLTGASYMVHSVLTPYTVFPSDVSDIAVGYEHSCAIKNEELFCWGSNEFSQLGISPSAPNGNDTLFPNPVSILTGVRQVAAHGRWTCAVANGQLLCFGSRLVTNGSSTVLAARLVSKTPKVMIDSGVIAVSMSANHACATLTTGGIKCFGMNSMGEVGIGDASGMDVAAPADVFADGVTSLSLTDGRSCLLRAGEPFCAGASLGDRAIDATAGAWKVASPIPYAAVFWSTLPGLKKMSANGTAISASGDLYYGSYFHSDGKPQKVAIGVIDFNFSEAELGGCMMFQNHSVKCWGPNLFGQVGIGKRSADEFTVFTAQDVQFPK